MTIEEIEQFKGKLLHPSLDIKDGLLILGFRYLSKEFKEENVFLVSNDESADLTTDIHFSRNNRDYSIELNKRTLMMVEQKWNLDKLIKFVENNNLGKESSIGMKKVLNNIIELSKKYLELEKEEDYILLSCWIIGTYFFPIFSAYPFLHIKAPKSSGKTQCLNFLKQLSFNAIKARPSIAALGDTVDSLRGTYLIDQADSLKRKGSEDLLDILTDSYKREGGKRRIMNMEKGKRSLLEHETYGPKVFASISDLPEDLADRCIIVPLIRSSKNFLEPTDDNENWTDIRGDLYKMLIDKFSQTKVQFDFWKLEYKKKPELIGRELELWLPLETILRMSIDGSEREQVFRRFRRLYGYTEYEANELEKAIINAVFKLLDRQTKNEITLRPGEIQEEIADDELWEEKFGTPHKRDIKVGYVVKKFNLSCEKKNTSSGVAYLFTKEKVKKIKSLFLKEENSTSDTSSELKNADIDNIFGEEPEN